MVLEHALDGSTGIAGREREILDDLRFRALWTWGFSSHNSAKRHLAEEAFGDRVAFVMDEIRYKAFLEELLVRAGSLANGFSSAHALCGVMAGFLTHWQLGARTDLNDVMQPDQFLTTPAYDAWLQSSTEELDALAQEREQKSTTPEPWWKF